MAIDKALNAAPTGLTAMQPSLDIDELYAEPNGPDIEIEIELDGDDEGEEDEAPPGFDDNLAEDMDDGQLTELAGDLLPHRVELGFDEARRQFERV